MSQAGWGGRRSDGIVTAVSDKRAARRHTHSQAQGLERLKVGRQGHAISGIERPTI